jgi:hypothetical protein
MLDFGRRKENNAEWVTFDQACKKNTNVLDMHYASKNG